MRSRPPRPVGAATEIAPGEDLQAVLDLAAPGEVLCLAPGVHPGGVVIRKSVTVWGPPEAVVRSRGHGSTIEVEADGVALLGFTIDGSGGRFDLLDAAVRVHGDDVHVEGLRVERALFGILVEQVKGATIRGNEVAGTAQLSLGLRGDGIRLWETYDSRVEGNFVTGCRDLVVWYSSRNHIMRNRVEGGRYGTHFMYCDGNRVEGNTYDGNVVGMFVMYSRNIEIVGNLSARCVGAAGMGLGVKESGNLLVEDNRFILCHTGIYLDLAPLQLEHTNTFAGNQLRLCDTAVAFHSSSRRNTFRGNTFQGSSRHVEVGGGGDAAEVDWQGNYWDDYRGYDLDADGVGDVPYRLRSLAGEMTSRYPDLAFLRGTPALGLVDAAGHALPIFTPQTLLEDATPLVRPPPAAEDDDAR